MPVSVRVAVCRASLAAADPQATSAVLVDGPDLVLQHGGHRIVGRPRGALEAIAACAPHEQALVVAQPQVSGTVLHHAEVARRGVAAGVDVADRVAAQVEMVQALLGGHPHTAGVVVGEGEDLAVGDAVRAAGIDVEGVARRVEAHQAAGVGADQHAAVRQGQQTAHVGVGQALDGLAADVEQLGAVAVVAGQPHHRAHPQQAFAILRQRGDDGRRKSFRAGYLVEPRRFERRPRIGRRGHARAGPEQQQQRTQPSPPGAARGLPLHPGHPCPHGKAPGRCTRPVSLVRSMIPCTITLRSSPAAPGRIGWTTRAAP